MAFAPHFRVEPIRILQHHAVQEIVVRVEDGAATIHRLRTALEVLDVAEDVRQPRHHVLHVHHRHGLHVAKVAPRTTLFLLHVGQHVGLADVVVEYQAVLVALGHSHEAIAEHIAVYRIVQCRRLVVVVILGQGRILVQRLNALA